MSAVNINRVTVSGNLTRDPELREIGPEQSRVDLCEMRIAINARRKRDNEWVDRPNYFDVAVWGVRGKLCSEHLHRGSGVAIDGRLEWREWEGKDGKHHEAVTIVADNVQFLWPKPKSKSEHGSEHAEREATEEPPTDVPADTTDLGEPEPVAIGPSTGEDGIPF